MAQPDAADDGVAGQRATAGRELYGLPLVPMYQDRSGRRAGNFVEYGSRRGEQWRFGSEAASHHGRQPFAQADVGKDFVTRLRSRTLRQFFPLGIVVAGEG